MFRAGAVVCAPRRAPRDFVAREPGVRAPTRASVKRSAKPAGAIRDPRGGSARAAWVREARDPDRVPRSVRLVHRGGCAELVLRSEGGGEAPPLGVRVRRVDVKMSCVINYKVPKSHRAGWTRLAIAALTSRSLSITSSSAAPESSPRTPSASLEYSSRVASNAARSAASEASSVAAPRPAGRAGEAAGDGASEAAGEEKAERVELGRGVVGGRFLLGR